MSRTYKELLQLNNKKKQITWFKMDKGGTSLVVQWLRLHASTAGGMGSIPGCVRGTTDWNPPLWPGKIVTTCMSYLTTGGPGKECRTNKLLPTGRIQERSKRGDASPYVPPTSQNSSHWNPSWLSDAHATRKDPESEWLARDNPETNPVTVKPETASHVAEQFSWVPLPCCSLPGCPFPIKFLALSARVSPRTINFWVLDKSPFSGPEGVPLPATAGELRFCMPHGMVKNKIILK